MATPYEIENKRLKNDIEAMKLIYKFRMFLYSLNRDVRVNCFRISREYFENEYNNNIEVSRTERERLHTLINHWEWTSFDTTSINWWSIIFTQHLRSLTLMTVIHLWIDDITHFDPESFETDTDRIC